jgi:hypothetical protein
VKYYGGSLKGLYGKDAKEIDTYVRELRDESDRDLK